ncbi:MAG: class I SAM-dependent methyltransferase [Candidatus Eisenbacteria bacterium]
MNLVDEFGAIDIYLFDQLLRGRIDPTMRILDAGCGSGRNSYYLARAGAPIVGIDEVVRTPAVPMPVARATVEALPFARDAFDCVLCSAVLHFLSSRRALAKAVAEMWRVLGREGILFVRLASSIGIEDRIRPIDGERSLLPDGSERLLVDEPFLLELGAQLGGALLDPLKTTNVQNLRAMTTWVLRKP